MRVSYAFTVISLTTFQSYTQLMLRGSTSRIPYPSGGVQTRFRQDPMRCPFRVESRP
jgi:hypothetical protein